MLSEYLFYTDSQKNIVAVKKTKEEKDKLCFFSDKCRDDVIAGSIDDDYINMNFKPISVLRAIIWNHVLVEKLRG